MVQLATSMRWEDFGSGQGEGVLAHGKGMRVRRRSFQTQEGVKREDLGMKG